MKMESKRPELEYIKVGKKYCCTFNLPNIAASCEVSIYADTRTELDAKVDKFFSPLNDEQNG